MTAGKIITGVPVDFKVKLNADPKPKDRRRTGDAEPSDDVDSSSNDIGEDDDENYVDDDYDERPGNDLDSLSAQNIGRRTSTRARERPNYAPTPVPSSAGSAVELPDRASGRPSDAPGPRPSTSPWTHIPLRSKAARRRTLAQTSMPSVWASADKIAKKATCQRSAAELSHSIA